MDAHKRNKDIMPLPNLIQEEVVQALEVVVYSPQDTVGVEDLEQQYRPFLRVHTAVDNIQESVG